MEDGGPSVTARRVAAHRLGFTRLPAAYGDPAADDALAADVAAGREAPANRIHDYLAARTSFFDRIVVAAIGRGVRQIVVGGAGYDGRALRYAKPGVRWFEADHPATQRDKRERLERLGIAAPHVRFVEADFTRDPVADRLAAAGLDAGAPSLFLLEGVAVYLEPVVLETVLDQFRQVAAAGSRLAISVSLSRDHDADARARFQASLAAMGEPARSTFDAAQAEDLLATTGWRIMAGHDDPDDQDAAAKRARLRSAGLLLASAGPRSPQAARRRRRSESSLTRPAPQPQGPLSLSALLSQALVAFTIAFDNEAEHRIPHRTANFGAASQGDGTAKKIHQRRPDADAVLRATARGLRAREAWRPLPGLIEQRWRERFGAGQMGRLRDSLLAVVSLLDPGLPDCLPILGPALLSRGPDPALPPRPDHVDLAGLPLSALLSRVLLSFAVEYERESARSLAVSANLLRVLDADGTRLRDLPPLTGISKEAVSWATGLLVRAHLAVEEPDPAGSRGKITRLTPAGTDAQRAHPEFLSALEQRWRERFTDDVIDVLRHALEALATASEGERPPLFQELEPYPDNWRASVRRPVTLPHYPMVLHRGGYPDGS